MFAVSPQTETHPPTPVILISIDTLRADHLGCYGYQKLGTPHFDAFGQHGTIFLSIDSPVPMTLPAHTSLLTSTYPFVHGVEENGQPVKPESVTLAGVLKAHGYRTAAFVGGYVLDAQFGLGQGFDLYDSPFHMRAQAGEDPPDLRRPGESVVRAATQWIGTKADQPFFVFIHFYDLHQPYVDPTTRGFSGYDTEIRYVDQALGQFQEFLKATGILQRALIVLTSDHGESLGEHGEKTHGYFIYQSTLRVPLIIHWPVGPRTYAARLDEPASLLDVAPTILQAVGISEVPQFQGRSLLRSLEPLAPKVAGPEEAIYAESLYARDHLNCSPLRSLRLGSYQYIAAPRPELYDLASDSGELHNLWEQKPSLVREMQQRLDSLRARYAPQQQFAHKSASPEVIARLRSLGYLASSRPRAVVHDSGLDPKDRLGEYLHYGDAIMLASEGHLPEAIHGFQEVLKLDPKNVLTHYYLAVCYYRSRRLDEAVKELNATLAVAPDYSPAEELLGTIWLQKRDYARAREQFTQLLTMVPGDYGAHYNLGILAMQDGRWEEASRHLHAAEDADPSSAQPLDALGSLYLRQGDLNRARNDFAKAIELNPMFARAHYNLGTVLLQQGRSREAAGEFRQALAADANFAEARKALQQLPVVEH
jgi:choline-sulfatase